MPELGNKYECYSCGTKFYDLGKPQPLCPKCGANQKDAAAAKPAHETATHRRKRKEEPARAVEVDPDEAGPAVAAEDGAEDLVEHEEDDEEDADDEAEE